MPSAATYLARIVLLAAATLLAAQTLEPSPAPAQTPAAGTTAPQEGPGTPNLTFQKFPAEFADYYTTQRLTGSPTEPRPFCKSAKPLLVDGSRSSLRIQAILDESGGTGTGYDTLYVDTGPDGDFAASTAYKVAPCDRKTGLEGRPLVSYFDNVSAPRDAAQDTGPHAQIFVEHDPAASAGDYVLNLIPAQWAVGAIQVAGQNIPVAMVDGTWSGNITSRQGLNRYGINQMAPGEDAAALRGTYLILGKPGETALAPGDPNGWLGQGGSGRALNTQYLVLDSGVYEVQADQGEGGVNLQLAPANVQTSTIDLSQVPRTGRLAMFGTNACVLLENPGSQVQVPGSTYYVPAFGAYIVDVPGAGGNVTLPPPEDSMAAGPQGYSPLADREQKLFTVDPPGGAIAWSQPQTDPFAFANRQASWRTMALLVANSQTGLGVAGAKVEVSTHTSNGWTWGSGTRTLTTDAAGRCSVRVPGTDLRQVSIEVQARGYVPAWKRWHTWRGEDIPAEYTWPAEPGVTIGGMVRDERDRPIRNAKLRIRAEAFGPAEMPEPILGQLDIRTDRQGKWKCDAAPARATQMRFRLAHPDYISDTDANRTAPMEQLRDMTAVMVMKKGINVDVRVLGPKGTPLANAGIGWGDGWGDMNNKTDRQGRFRIRNQAPGVLPVGVRATDCAMDMKKVAVEPNMQPVTFRMEAAKGLKGRVIDKAGDPIALASVVLQRWREGFYLYWTTRTDAQGRWSWPDAPNDSVFLTIDAEGYTGTYLQLAPGPQEHVTTLKKPITIRGRALDANTGQPIPVFKALLGFDQEGMVYWMRYETAKGKDGVYTLTPGQQFDEYRVRIEANGYFPAVSEIITDTDLPPSVDLSLTPGQDLVGTVLGPGSQPLADVDVVVAMQGQPARLDDGRLGRLETGILSKTGPDGVFRLPPQTEAYTLVAVHEQGYGQVSRKDFEKSHQVRLERWGRIEGMARIGDRPLATETFYISSSSYYGTEDLPIGFYYNPVTDEAGRFTIDHMVPGIWSIEWSRGQNNEGMVRSLLAIEVKPGQTSRLDLGAKGRTVTGRMRLAGHDGLKFEPDSAGGSLRLLRAGPKPPASLPSQNAQALQAWYDGWLKSERGKEYRLSERSYSFRPLEDGTFEVPDVAAGQYVLYVSMSQRTGPEKMTAAALVEFEVPPMPDGRSDTPLDLGSIPLKRSADIKAGDPAPRFSARTFDGQLVDLNTYRGKYLLLSFWVSWTDYGVYHEAMLKTVQKQFGQDDRLVILGLNLDKQVEDARIYAQLHGMTWPQARLGEWAATGVPAAYGVSWLPHAVLVSPEGTILLPYGSGYQVRSELIKGLGKPSASQPATRPTASTKPAGQ